MGSTSRGRLQWAWQDNHCGGPWVLLGIEGVARKESVADVGKRAEAAPRWIWLKRNERWQSQTGSREGQG
ncbi:unnamed protein product [Lampetra planeri]